MKNLKKMGQAAFTLVELMVVVAIIGILATVAIPQYSKFQSKARQSEAKVSLGAIGQLESAFAAQANKYSSCIAAMGFGRDGTTFYYTVGFGAGNTYADPGNPVAGGCTISTSSGGGSWFTANAKGKATSASSSVSSSATSTDTTYSAGAEGNISTSSINNDGWSLDNTGALKNSAPNL